MKGSGHLVARLTWVVLLPMAGCSADEPAAGKPTVEPTQQEQRGPDSVVEKEREPEDPQALFVAGRAKIERNCHDCYEATREGLLEGMALVERATELGYADRVAASQALAGAYRTMAFTFAEDPAEHQIWMAKHREAAAQVLRLMPDDPEALLRYSDTLDDEEEQVATLRRVVALAPEHVAANYGLGMILLDRGEAEEATPYLMRAAENATGLDAQHYLPAIEAAFLQAGRPDLVERVKAMGEGRG